MQKIGLLVAGCFVAVMFFNQFSEINELNGQINETSAQYTEELQVSAEIDARGDVYASKEFVEQEAREMGFVYPNERVFIDQNNTASK
ncbi:MAG: septum formation initiator family protein [Clostridia bacterium]|nr:septum formation initiator family protein [Clostridia bacterium]